MPFFAAQYGYQYLRAVWEVGGLRQILLSRRHLYQDVKYFKHPVSWSPAGCARSPQATDKAQMTAGWLSVRLPKLLEKPEVRPASLRSGVSPVAGWSDTYLQIMTQKPSHRNRAPEIVRVPFWGIRIINEDYSILASDFLETTRLTWALTSHLTALFALNRMSQLLLWGCANAALLVGRNAIMFLGRGKTSVRLLGVIRSITTYLGSVFLGQNCKECGLADYSGLPLPVRLSILQVLHFGVCKRAPLCWHLPLVLWGRSWR